MGEIVMVFTQLENLKMMYMNNLGDQERLKDLKDAMIDLVDRLEPDS
jgi:predicted RNA-binding protein with EMAP domain